MSFFVARVRTSLLLCLLLPWGARAGADTLVSFANLWSGAALTAWSSSKDSYIWGYWPYYYRSGTDRVNWHMSNHDDGSIVLQSAATGYCLTEYDYRYVIQSICLDGQTRQRFRALPTEGGAFLLRNAIAGGQCVVMEASANYRYAFVVRLESCPEQDRVIHPRFMWVRHPPLAPGQVAPHDEL